jgi:hypothetical protein
MIKLLIFIFSCKCFKRCKVAKSLKKLNTPLWAFRAEYVKRKMNRTRKKGHSRKVSLLPYEAFLLRHSSLFYEEKWRDTLWRVDEIFYLIC